MINCPKCGADNLLNAIFCRTCGEKLNLDELKPTEVGPSEEDKKRLAQQKLMNQIGGGIIAVILAVVLGGILIPPGGKLKGAEPSADAMAKFEAGKCKPKAEPAEEGGKKDKKKGDKKGGKKKKEVIPDVDLTFTNEEATNIANKTMGLLNGPSGEGNMVANNVSVNFLASGNVKIILSCTAYKFAPVNYVIEWKPNLTGRGALTLEDVNPKVGLLPMPVKQAADFVKQQFAAMSGKCGEMGEVRKNLKSVKVEEGRLLITCGK
jgi:hypothetical protein